MAHPVKHFKTITKHRHKVIAHCKKAGILWQGLRHDLSKYSPVEFLAGARYYAGTYSPNENERRDKGYSSAWLHHKGRNRHHFEYWTDYNSVEKRVMPVKMPIKYVAEMFCDRVAASKIYKGENYTNSSALEYFENGNAARQMHPKTAELLREWLKMLTEQGEDKTFNHIKKVVKESKKK